MWRQFRTPRISQSFSYCELINLLRNGTIVRCLWVNKKTSEKSVFREAWSPEYWHHNRSQSPVFGLVVLYPTGSEICYFWYIKTRERKIAMEKTFLLHLVAHWGDLIEQIKKICHIHFNSLFHQEGVVAFNMLHRELFKKWHEICIIICLSEPF